MTDPDVQYIRDVARGYANSFVNAWVAHYQRLNKIADRLEKFIAEEESKKESAFDTLPDDYEAPHG